LIQQAMFMWIFPALLAENAKPKKIVSAVNWQHWGLMLPRSSRPNYQTVKTIPTSNLLIRVRPSNNPFEVVTFSRIKEVRTNIVCNGLGLDGQALFLGFMRVGKNGAIDVSGIDLRLFCHQLPHDCQADLFFLPL
jgi:hypothetical protein